MSDIYLRPFDVQRDLGPVADLVETCFAETLDPDGKRYIERMRSAAKNKSFLHWAALNFEIPNMPFSGYVWEQDGRMIGNASNIAAGDRIPDRFNIIKNTMAASPHTEIYRGTNKVRNNV